MNRKPILIAGLHRSGTTWLAKMLSLPWEVKYISEPFNPNTGLKVFTDWMVYISEANQAKYLPEIEKPFKFRGKFRFNLPALKYWATGLVLGQKRVLIKGVGGAVYSAEWLVKNFDLEMLGIIRHPAAFYASLKRMNWRFDFNNLLKQDDLMKDYLSPFKDKMEKKDMSFAEEAGLLWLVVNYVLDIYVTRNSNWILVRHEDLSANSVDQYQELYRRFGLDFTPQIEKAIRVHSGAGNVSDVSDYKKALILKRDSKSIVKNWQKHLSAGEVEIIRNITG